MLMKSDKQQSLDVLICGGGHQGVAMAAHFSLSGLSVGLWNRTARNIQRIMDTRTIHCDGVVEGEARIDAVSDQIGDVIADFIIIAAPSLAHRDIARRLAPYVHRHMSIVLMPGRTFGAVEFLETLKEAGAKEMPQIAETQTIVYTCRRQGDQGVRIFALKQKVLIAALKESSMDHIMQGMPACLAPHFEITDSIAKTSMANVGMILHCAPVLMNTGWIEFEAADFAYYHQGISPTVAHFLEKLDRERLAIAKAAGHPVESVLAWLRRSYETEGETLYAAIQNNTRYSGIDAPTSMDTRYILEDVPNGLVPIEYLGQELGVPTPHMTAIIDLASLVYERDFRAQGRRFGLQVLKQEW